MYKFNSKAGDTLPAYEERFPLLHRACNGTQSHIRFVWRHRRREQRFDAAADDDVELGVRDRCLLYCSGDPRRRKWDVTRRTKTAMLCAAVVIILFLCYKMAMASMPLDVS